MKAELVQPPPIPVEPNVIVTMTLTQARQVAQYLGGTTIASVTKVLKDNTASVKDGDVYDIDRALSNLYDSIVSVTNKVPR